MKRALLLFAIGCGGSAPTTTYPVVHPGPIADDPYRGLEQMDEPETASWADAENKLTDAALRDVPGKADVHARLAELYAREEVYPPSHRGSRYFWGRRDATHDQPIILVATSLDGDATTLLDPSEFSQDGSLQLAGSGPSQDGALFAYGLAAGGGDWTTWRFRDTSTGKDLPDELPNVKYYEPAFTADHVGVYYSRFPAPEKGKELTETDHDCKLYFHRIGTPVADDKVVYEVAGHPDTQFEPHTTFDGKYLVVAVGEGQVGDTRKEQIVAFDLSTPDPRPIDLVSTYTAEYELVGNIGSGLLFITDANA